MAAARWAFAPNEMREVEGPNNAGISAFTSDRAGSLVRELLQNSMDAREDRSKPVIVSFTLENLPADGLDLDGLRLSLEAAIDSDDNDERHKKQFRRGLSVLKDAIRNRAVPALAITDSNTTGAPDTDGDGNKNKWRSLTKSQGKSEKDARDSGGSFGIGKHATFAASDLRTVLYSTAWITRGGGGIYV